MSSNALVNGVSGGAIQFIAGSAAGMLVNYFSPIKFLKRGAPDNESLPLLDMVGMVLHMAVLGAAFAWVGANLPSDDMTGGFPFSLGILVTQVQLRSAMSGVQGKVNARLSSVFPQHSRDVIEQS